MNEKKPGLSFGSILAILLTLAVSAGSLLFFAGMQGEDHDARMDAEKIIRVLGDALQGPTPEINPQATVRTVTVTLAPQAAMATPEPYVAPTAAPAAQETAYAAADHTFTLTVGGLLGFHSDISDAVYDKKSKTFDYASIFTYLGDHVNADLNLITLDGVLNTENQKYSDTYTPASCLDGIKESGFDGILLNTEHVLDYGAQGAEKTVSAIGEKGFFSLGINAGNGYQHQMISLNGGSVALLSYTDVLTAKGKNALEEQNGKNMLQRFDEEVAAWDIQNARKQGARCVIVLMYWGKEDATSITSAQRKTANALAAAGADLILGVHPSRVLPMEWIDTQDEAGKTRKTLAVYSLGSMLTESREGYDISGVLLHLNITCSAQGGVTFNRVEYTPTYIWRQYEGNKWQYRVVCSAEEAPENMEQKQQEVMARALSRIQKTLEGTPATQHP